MCAVYMSQYVYLNCTSF